MSAGQPANMIELRTRNHLHFEVLPGILDGTRKEPGGKGYLEEMATMRFEKSHKVETWKCAACA